MNHLEEKLDIVMQQNEELIAVIATLIRTLEKKGQFTKQDFGICAAVGKQLHVNNLVFGVGKK